MYKIDNFEEIKKFLVFNKEKKDIYYFIQVIQRRKDNPELPKDSICRGRWFISGINEYKIFEDWIKKTCMSYNARAYISLTPRSLEKLGKKCLLEYSKRVSLGDYNNIYSIPYKAALSDYTISSRGLVNKPRWIIDIDSTDRNSIETAREYLIGLGIAILGEIKTPGGIHLIIEAFNISKISEYRKGKTDDYRLLIGYSFIEFTLRKEANTILFSYKS